MFVRIHPAFATVACVLLGGCANPGLNLERDAPLETVTTRLDLPAAPAAATQATASPERGLTITRQQALALAFRDNPEVGTHLAGLGLSAADLIAARTLRNPVLDLATRFPAGDGRINLEFDLIGDLLQVLQRPARIEAGTRRLEQSILQISDTLLEFATRVDRAYLGLQAAQHQLELLTALSAQSLAHAQRSQALAARDLLDRTTAVRDEALASRTAAAVVNARLAVIEARGEYARMLGNSGGNLVYLPPSRLPELPAAPSRVEAPDALAIKERLDIQAAVKAIDARAVEQKVVLDWRWWGALQGGLSGERDPDGWGVLGPTLSIAVPIFDRGAAQLTRAAAELQTAQGRMATLAVEIQQAALTAQARVQELHTLAAHYRDGLLPLQKTLVEMLTQQVERGLNTPLALYEARRDALTASELYVRALRDYWLAEAALRRALGGGRAPGLLQEGQTATQ